MSSGMGMVARVAALLEPAAWAAVGKFDSPAYAFYREDSCRRARKIIKAMREPTDQMVWTANRLNHPRDRDVWITMCDAALQDGENER